MAIEFDFSELKVISAQLGDVPAGTVKNLNSAMQFTSTRIKSGTARKVGRRHHFRQAAGAIDYDVSGLTGVGADVIEAEIGYDKNRRAGALGNLIEFGAPNASNSLTPGNELVTTLHEEEPDFVRGVMRAVDDAHEDAGLA